MVYLVSGQKELFDNSDYTAISVEVSLQLLESCEVLQYDSETDGRDAHVNRILCFQFGSKIKGFQIVVDCSTINILLYKRIFETKFIVGQNLKFDLQFLYNYNIIPRKIYDTMIVEQLLYLGYSNNPKDPSFISVSLASIAKRRLGVNIDKSIRGEIIWRGLDSSVIKYAATDVVYLEDIMWSQIKDCRKNHCMVGAKLECDFVPVIAYMEWSGIKLDVALWKQKMIKDQAGLEEAKKALDDFVVKTYRKRGEPEDFPFVFVDPQGDLFSGFNLEPQCTILWSSSKQVIPFAKFLGFDTIVQDKKTGEDKDTVLEKHLKSQKGIDDEFLKLYFTYQEYAKLVSSFGQGHIDAINPRTGRIHTNYKQLGADTGRMSSGSKQNNTDLAKLKHIKTCKYPNMQQLPHDAFTRSCFVAEKGNLWVSCDYSAIESRLGADIYNEKSMIDEFLHGSGDMHSLVAKMVFDELKNVPVKDIKRLYPDLRSQAKPIEFSQQFGGSAHAIQNAMGCTMEKAEAFANAYAKGFPGIAEFKKKGAAAVRKNGYIVLSPQTGHKTYWWDHDEWLKREASHTKEFWDNYRNYHKGTGDDVHMEVKHHFQAVSKWERKALNSVTQGLGAVILKDSQIDVFNWVVDNGYFGKILLCNLTHDEANWEFPKEVQEFPSILQNKMEKAAAKYCKSLPIPAVPEISTHWVH